MTFDELLPTSKWIEKHIQTCTTKDQLNNMRNFYRMVISKQWFPDSGEADLSYWKDYIGEIIKEQDKSCV